MPKIIKQFIIAALIIGSIAALFVTSLSRDQQDYTILCPKVIAAQDYKNALVYCKKAADKNNLQAQYYMGWMYDAGKGTVQDYKTAFEWYQKSAYQGFQGSQYNLGAMYALGKGIKQDYVFALAWYIIAAQDANNDQVIKVKNLTESMMTPDQITKAQDIAKQIQSRIVK